MYVHSDKESSYDLAARLGLDNEAQDNFRYTGCEIKLGILVYQDGTSALTSVNDVELKDYILNF